MSYTISLYNILIIKLGINIPFFFSKQILHNKQRTKFLRVLLGFHLLNSSILGSFVKDIIVETRQKMHIKNLMGLSRYIKLLFNSKAVCLRGFKLEVKGKLGGKLRKSKYIYKLGYTGLTSFFNTIGYSLHSSFTKYGVFSVKI